MGPVPPATPIISKVIADPEGSDLTPFFADKGDTLLLLDSEAKFVARYAYGDARS